MNWFSLWQRLGKITWHVTWGASNVDLMLKNFWDLSLYMERVETAKYELARAEKELDAFKKDFNAALESPYTINNEWKPTVKIELQQGLSELDDAKERLYRVQLIRDDWEQKNKELIKLREKKEKRRRKVGC